MAWLRQKSFFYSMRNKVHKLKKAMLSIIKVKNFFQEGQKKTKQQTTGKHSQITYAIKNCVQDI